MPPPGKSLKGIYLTCDLQLAGDDILAPIIIFKSDKYNPVPSAEVISYIIESAPSECERSFLSQIPQFATATEWFV